MGVGGGWNHQSEDKFVSLKGAGNEAAGRDGVAFASRGDPLFLQM